MNNKLSQLFSEHYGMTVDKNSAYGKIKGYEVNATINTFDNSFPLKIYISCYTTDEQKRNMEAAIRNLALKYFKPVFTQYGLTLNFNDITLGRLIKRLPDELDKIFGILTDNGALTSEYCPVCGKPFEEGSYKKCNVEGINITIDNECVETINSVISEENKDFENAPNNYLKGFAGAVLGALVGAVLSVILNLIGFVSSISAIISVILGSFLYQKFHGKPNKMMIVIVSLTTLVLLAATIPAIYITAAGIAANQADLGLTAIEAFVFLMEEPEFANMFYADLALVVLFTAIGVGYQIYALSKQIKRKQNIK